jgi:hypothetical protein
MVGDDAASLTIGNLSATARAAARELGWGLRLVNDDQARRRARAALIPDPTFREDALVGLRAKRSVTNGAAFFWTLPRARHPELHRLLLAFQTLANLLDVISERDARESGRRPMPWVRAIEDAVRPHEPPSRPVHPHDDGYIAELVTSCRQGCLELPAFACVSEVLAREARRARALDLEHDPHVARRHDGLRAFARRHFDDTDLTWFELTAGASSMLTIIVTLVLAADPRTTQDHAVEAVRAYRLIGTLSALLDNYIDQLEDQEEWVNNYLGLYGSTEEAVGRIGVLIERALAEAGALPDGERHVVLVASMVAMFLTSRSATRGRARSDTYQLIGHGGAMTRLLMGPLAVWRRAQRVLEG